MALLPLAWALLHASGWTLWGAAERLDAPLQDARARLFMPHTLDPRVTIVAIDEKSLAEIGPWPWRRDHLARLMDELFARQQVEAVGFDLVFDTPDPDPGTGHSAHHDAHHDAQFARALQHRPVVLGYRFHEGAAGLTTGVLPAPVMSDDSLHGQSVRLYERSGYTANIEPLARAAPLAGFVDVVADADGHVRAIPMLIGHQGHFHEALGLAMFRLMLGHPSIEPVFPQGATHPARFHGLESLHLHHDTTSVVVPVADGVTARLPFRGPGGAQGGSFTYVSASDLLAGRVPAGQLQGQAIFVGLTAAGLGERHTTAVGTAYPGVELHASLLSGLLDDRLPVQPDFASGYGMLVLIGAGLLLALALPVLSVPRAVALYVGVMAGIVGLNLWLFLEADLTLPLAPALLMATAAFALSMGYGYWVEGRARRELAALFGRYVPPELVQALVRDPRSDPTRAVSRQLTVMFCDIRGFTALSKRMEPAAVQALLNRVFGLLSEVIRAHRGTIDKYMGDCVMAFWGAPVDTPDHARLAVEAALKLSSALEPINEEHRRHGLPELSLGIGLNTGLMCVGDMGSRLRRTYTVIGDAVNLAACLEDLSARYGVAVLAGEATRRSTEGHFTWQELDKVRVKGRAHAVTLFAPLPADAEQDKSVADELRTWAAFLKAYRAQDWPSCERILPVLISMHPEKSLYALYAERLSVMRDSSFDPDWDGAAVMGS